MARGQKVFCYGIEEAEGDRLICRFKSKEDRARWILNDEGRREAKAREVSIHNQRGRWVPYTDGPYLVDCEFWVKEDG